VWQRDSTLYDNCIKDNPLGRGALDPDEYCKIVATPTWSWGIGTPVSLGSPGRSSPQQGEYVPSEYLIAERPLGDTRASRPAIITDDIVPVIGETRPFQTRAGTIHHKWDGVKWVQTTLMPSAGTVLKGAEGVSIINDVVDLLGDIFTDDPDSGWWDTMGRPPPPAVMTPAPVVIQGGGGGVPPPPPGYPMAAAGSCGPSGPQPVYKQVCGVYKWVTPKRRRRRQLLTDSDYDSLLKLQTLKVNSNMTAAISKALTR